MYYMTQMYARESVETPTSISLVSRLVEVEVDSSSAVGVEASSSYEATTTTDEMTELEIDSHGGTKSNSLFP
jgi:hypothetical protein